MHDFRIDINLAKEKIFAGKMKEADFFLSQMTATQKEQCREVEHLRSVIQMRQGHFEAAITVFLNALSSYGNHVALLLDLAAAYYASEQIQNWSRIIQLAEFEYKQAHHRLSWVREVDFLLLLGKFKEEQGCLMEALELYKQNLTHFNPQQIEKIHLIQYLRILAQIVRIQAQYSIKMNVSHYYTELCSQNKSETNWDCDFEIQHALCLFEIKNIGFEVGLSRVEKLLTNPLMQTYEKNLILIDVLYEVVYLKKDWPKILSNRMTEIDFGTSYNVAVLNLATQGEISKEDYLMWSEKWPLAAHLRILALWIKISRDTLLSKKYNLLIHSLIKESKNVWAQLAKDLKPENNLITIVFHQNEKTLRMKNSENKIQLSDSFNEIIDMLAQNNSIETIEALELLWTSGGSMNDIARLRMRLSRLNTLVEKSWGLT
jgi:tetratricopeptide (TPR) repeat protein